MTGAPSMSALCRDSTYVGIPSCRRHPQPSKRAPSPPLAEPSQYQRPVWLLADSPFAGSTRCREFHSPPDSLKDWRRGWEQQTCPAAAVASLHPQGDWHRGPPCHFRTEEGLVQEAGTSLQPPAEAGEEP